MRLPRVAAYPDREEAGRVLADLLSEHMGPPCVVVGVPRGGMLVADPIAERFGCVLTMSFARKLALPESPEVAFGAIDEDGHVVVDHPRFHDLAGQPHDLFRARARVAQEIERQQRAFPVPRLDAFLPRCTVLLVDDGLATGYTMRAASPTRAAMARAGSSPRSHAPRLRRRMRSGARSTRSCARGSMKCSSRSASTT